MTIKEAIEKGKQIIADWQWAYVCQDQILMDKFSKERVAFENSLMRDYDEDFVCEYFSALD